MGIMKYPKKGGITMAKEKQTQKMLAMALAASVAAGAMPIPAFADVVADNDSTTTETTTEGTTEKSTTITGDGTPASPTVELEVSITKNADDTVKEKETKKTTSYTETDAAQNTTQHTEVEQQRQTGSMANEPSDQDTADRDSFVDGFTPGTTTTEASGTTQEQTESHTTVTDSKGRPIENSGAVSGSETITEETVQVEQKEEPRPDDPGNDEQKTETTPLGTQPIVDDGEYQRVPILDENGDPVLDASGNPVMEEQLPVDTPDLTTPDADAVTVGLDRESIDPETGDPILMDSVENTGTASVYEDALVQLKQGLDTDIQDAFHAEYGNDAVIDKTGDTAAVDGTVEYSASRVENGNTVVTTVKLIPKTEMIGDTAVIIGYTTEKSEVITPITGVTESDITLQTGQEFGYTYSDIAVDEATGGEPVVTTRTEIKLPEDMPEEGAVTVVTDEETGHTQTTTVAYIRELIDGKEQVVGYKDMVVLTNADGVVIGGGEKVYNGKRNISVTTSTKEVLKTTTIDTDTKQTIVTTKEIVKNITTSTAVVDVAKLDREVWAQLWGITYETGGTDIQSLQSKVDLNGDTAQDLASIGTEYIKYNLGPDGKPGTADDPKPDDDQIQYLRHVLKSDFRIARYIGTDEGHITNFIYELADKDGTKFYGYCVDLATDANRGYFYEIENLEDQDYYQNTTTNGIVNTDATDKLRAIALNGFWGTATYEKDAEGNIVYQKDTDGNTVLDNDGNPVPVIQTGSLQAVKNLLISKGYETEAAGLTEGMALAATQAALWVYGNCDPNRSVNTEDIVDKYVSNKTVSETDEKIIQTLFDVLTDLPGIEKDAAEAGTNILDETDFLGSSITVINKVEDVTDLQYTDATDRFSEDVNADEDNTNDVYETNIGFKLAIVPGDHPDDALSVYIMDNQNKLIRAETLDNAHKGGGEYEVTGVVLQEGVTINLKISGTQHLDQGVYLYTSEKIDDKPSQTFISVAEGKRNVNLDVNMQFTVNEPEIDLSGSRKRHTEKRTEHTTTERTFHETEKVVSAFVEVTTTEVTTTENTWNGDYKETWSYPSNNGTIKTPVTEEETPPVSETPKPIDKSEETGAPTEPEEPGIVLGAETELTDGDTLLDDEDMLLSGIPQTGDESHAAGYGATALAALAGILTLNKRGKTNGR